MPLYRLIRHVVYIPSCQQTREVWGIDRHAPGISTVRSPKTDADDPIRGPCSLLLVLRDGEHVTWERITEWVSEAEEAGYDIIGLQKLSPYSTILVRGP